MIFDILAKTFVHIATIADILAIVPARGEAA